MKNSPIFPFRLFRWYFLRQATLSFAAILVLSIVLLLWLQTGLALEAALLALLAGFAVFLLISALLSRRVMMPLGRLIEKTKRLVEFPSDGDSPEEMTFDEPGEWFELERALNRLGHDLHQKTIRLSREKTELRAIMASVSEAVLAVSLEKRVLFFNPQFAYLFNLQNTPADAQLTDLLRSPDVVGAYLAALEGGVPVRREVQVEVSSERLPRDFNLSVAPLRKKHNEEIYGVVGILHDITELKQAERIRIEFVGNVSHELRTPLTAISGYLQTLVKDFESGRLDQAQEFLGIVNQNVTRLKSLVDDLLDLSALESGQELLFERVHVREITEDVLKQVQAHSHKIHILYEFDEMTADANRLEQVLRNLLENAVRYVPKQGNIWIRWSASEDGGYKLVVQDDGPGIGAEHQKRLFERFYRVDESRSRAAGGTGIGLSLVKHIMQRHGGSVGVYSEPGKGSEFVCRFPAQPGV